MSLLTLGFESSCDDSAVALLDAEGRVLASRVASQAEHDRHGGIVPELASRAHLQRLPGLLSGILADSATAPKLVAATAGPGLMGSLLVALRFAAAFAWARQLPFVAVDHLEGHLVSPWLDPAGEAAEEIPDEALILVASGGHSAWYRHVGGSFDRLSRTRDDAAGESFDKIARAMGLGYPGGPHIDRHATAGDPKAVALPRPRIKKSLDMSFSGLKSAALRHLQSLGEPSSAQIDDLAASFQAAAVDCLLRPMKGLCDERRPSVIAAAGGVAANTGLRAALQDWCSQREIPLRLVSPAFATDNAAMIARAGQLAAGRGELDDPREVDAFATRHWQPPGMRRAG